MEIESATLEPKTKQKKLVTQHSMEFDHRKSHVTEKNERSICIPIDIKFPCKSKLKWRQNVALVLSES